MSATMINRSELERIKASILPSIEDNSRIERRKELKKKSEDRLKNWPNTLEALRLKKESFLKDREAEEEAKRQEIDREVCVKYSSWLPRGFNLCCELTGSGDTAESSSGGHSQSE
jgi:hypothetical protein